MAVVKEGNLSGKKTRPSYIRARIGGKRVMRKITAHGVRTVEERTRARGEPSPPTRFIIGAEPSTKCFLEENKGRAKKKKPREETQVEQRTLA